eukprot:s1036_g7.t1
MPDRRIDAERFRDVDMVPLENVLQTCMFCKPHSHFQNDDCPKCGIFKAWSDGKKDVCHVLPPKNSEELITLLTGAAVAGILIFVAIEILQAPLVIVDAKSDLADSTEAESDRTFMLSVQGPIVDLHRSLSRAIHQRLRYRAKGTGLIWLDSDQKKSNTIKVCSIGRRKLLLQDTNAPFDCASCKGSLHATEMCGFLSLLTAFISTGAMLPAVIYVAVISGNGVEHIFVTAIYLTLPLLPIAAVLHFPVAWLIRRLYRRTSFSEALDEYRKQINRKPLTEPDATHPGNQGLQVLILRGLWKHFESFSIMTSEGFAALYLWQKGFWLKQANNQWNIEAELGSDPMESAFARALRAGIRGVAMVLDQEVQPLTSHSAKMLAAAPLTLRWRTDIFKYIISELGSLERMDDQIRALMAEMLMRNLANVERATGSLVDRLGQGSATVATVYEERCIQHFGFCCVLQNIEVRLSLAERLANGAHFEYLLLPVTEKIQSLADFAVALSKVILH